MSIPVRKDLPAVSAVNVAFRFLLVPKVRTLFKIGKNYLATVTLLCLVVISDYSPLLLSYYILSLLFLRGYTSFACKGETHE